MSFDSSNWRAMARYLLPVVGLIVVVLNTVALDTEQAAIDFNEVDSNVEIRSSNLHDPSTWLSIDVEICKGDCTFVVFFGERAVLMQKNGIGQVRELTFAPRENLKNWSEIVEIEDLPLDLPNNPLVDIGGEEYVFTIVRGHEIWRVSGDQHIEFDESSDTNSRSSEGLYFQNDSNAGPSGSTQEPCLDVPLPEVRDVVCNETVRNSHISWNNCFVKRCPDGSQSLRSCEAKSVSLPEDLATEVFIQITTICN